MSFYGNIKAGIRSPFVFDAVYSSRYEMEQNMQKDNIYNGRYVLVDYGEKTPARFAPGYVRVYINYFDPEKTYYTESNGTYTKVDGDFDATQAYYIQTDSPYEGIDESSGYGKNRKIDADYYHANYDATVWQKVWRSVDFPPSGTMTTSQYIPDGADASTVWEKYIMVAELNAQAPRLVLVTDAPGDDAQPHFDMAHSTTLDYRLHMPRDWQWSVDDWTTDPSDSDKIAKDVAEYNNGKTPNINRFDFNEAGFDPSVRSESTKDDRTYLFERISGADYPTHDAQDKTIQLCDGVHNYLTDQNQPDTKVLGIDLPSIGNVISQIWDLIYSGKDSGDGGSRKLLIKMARDLAAGDEAQRIVYNSADGSTVTLAAFINYMLDTVGKAKDNVYQGELTGQPINSGMNYNTWYGYYNAFKDLFGGRFDTVDAPANEKYFPIYDEERAAEGVGYITADTFNTYLSTGRPIYYQNGTSYEPIEYKTIIQNGEEVLSDEPNHAYDTNTKYYTNTLSIWAYLNDLMSLLRNMPQPDWEYDFLNSKRAILNRPDLVYNQEVVVQTDDVGKEWYSGLLRSDGTTSVKKAVHPQTDAENQWQDTAGNIYNESDVRVLGKLPENLVSAFEEYRKLNNLPQTSAEEGYQEVPMDNALKIEEIWASIWGEKDITTEVIQGDEGGTLEVLSIAASDITSIVNNNFTF